MKVVFMPRLCSKRDGVVDEEDGFEHQRTGDCLWPYRVVRLGVRAMRAPTAAPTM
jgi:hypothetical protein